MDPIKAIFWAIFVAIAVALTAVIYTHHEEFVKIEFKTVDGFEELKYKTVKVEGKTFIAYKVRGWWVLAGPID